MNFVEPLGVYFADVGKTATLNGKTIKVIYDDSYQQNLGILEGLNPQAHCQEADVVGVAHGNVLAIQLPAGTVNFTVREVQPDINGIVVLQLRAP
jgi:hypothetical protein